MTEKNHEQNTHRRGFLGMLASGAAALGLTALATPLQLNAQQQKVPAKPGAPVRPKSEGDLWFDKLKGTHRVVYDATRPHEILPFVWPKVFLMTNAATGTPETDCGVVVVLRHEAICYAFNDEIWSKYNFTEMFKAGEPGPAYHAADGSAKVVGKNPFWMTKHGDFQVPGIGIIDIGIRDLQASGVMFCVCNAAMTVYSNVAAGQVNMKPEEVMKEWKANLIPGIQIVPSGVWALGRAQERKCAYIFAG
ncbi:MAG TPA: twin-arginine translocation signal domain-containing protein [Bacteroidia bacterium]|nr:twin-arginine translocation signal domain-containing protein [Bacteroidia bacterium]